MRNRLFMGALSVIGVAMSLTGCTNPSGLDSIAVTPSTQALAVGQTAELSVTGTYGNANHLSTQPVSSGVTWSSNTTSVATVSATGVVTRVASGTATITATSTEDATKFGTFVVTVTVPGSGPTCAGMSLGNEGSLNGFVPFPTTAAWNTNIASASLDPNNAAITAGADFAGEHAHAGL